MVAVIREEEEEMRELTYVLEKVERYRNRETEKQREVVEKLHVGNSKRTVERRENRSPS